MRSAAGASVRPCEVPPAGKDPVYLDAVDAVLVSEESKSVYLALATLVDRLILTVQPDPAINAFRPMRTVSWVIAPQIPSLTPEANNTKFMHDAERLLDQSINAASYEKVPRERRIACYE